jgi:hypothetical protein
MSSKILGAFILLLFLLFLVFTFSFQYGSVAYSDNKTGVINASRNAMTDAVNLGNARVNESITINEEIAVESVLRQYSDTTDFFDGGRYLNIYQVSSDPAMIAVESYVSVDTPMKSMLKNFTGKQEDSNLIGRSREIIIYEAKNTVRP